MVGMEHVVFLILEIVVAEIIVFKHVFIENAL